MEPVRTMKCFAAVHAGSPMKSVSTMEPAASVCSVGVVVVINDCPAMRYVGVVVVDDRVVVPIRVPMMPSPAVSAEEANWKAETKRYAR